MSVIFSRQCEYALQAVIYMAARGAGERTSIKELAARLKLPYHFLGKILQELTRKRLLTSLKGPTGGFALAVAPETMTPYDVVEAIDGQALFTSCVLGLPECGGKHPCPVHDRWGELRDSIRRMLTAKTIGDLAGEGRRQRMKFIG